MALVYHISKISWNLNNPYFLSMQDLTIEQSGTKLKKRSEFHFLLKLFNKKDQLDGIPYSKSHSPLTVTTILLVLGSTSNSMSMMLCHVPSTSSPSLTGIVSSLSHRFALICENAFDG